MKNEISKGKRVEWSALQKKSPYQYMFEPYLASELFSYMNQKIPFII